MVCTYKACKSIGFGVTEIAPRGDTSPTPRRVLLYSICCEVFRPSEPTPMR